MSQLRKMERRKQKKLHLLGGEERVQVKAGDMEPFGISKSGYNAIYQAGFEAGVKAEREKLTLYYARYFTHQILAVCCKILMEHYGEMLGDDESTEQYLRYIENYGIHINWKEPET